MDIFPQIQFYSCNIWHRSLSITSLGSNYFHQVVLHSWVVVWYMVHSLHHLVYTNSVHIHLQSKTVVTIKKMLWKATYFEKEIESTKLHVVLIIHAHGLIITFLTIRECLIINKYIQYDQIMLVFIHQILFKILCLHIFFIFNSMNDWIFIKHNFVFL